jgi:hypothetical protein
MSTRKFLLHHIFEELKKGKNPSKIAKDLSISKQKTQYYIGKLKREGYIQKKGYGVWEVKKSTLNTLELKQPKPIRGHAFIWKVKTPKEIKGWLDLLNSKDVDYKLVTTNVPRVFIKNRKVWLGKKHIIIYENTSYYAKDSINARKYAVISLLELLQALEHKLGVNLKPYVFKPSREHYGIIKNELARQCNRKGEKIIIRDNLEGQWLWIDDSESLSELENGGTKAVVRSKQVQNWWNDHKKHNFEMTPTLIKESIMGLTTSQSLLIENFTNYSKHIKAHTESIKALSKAIPKLTKMLENTKKENQQLKQRRLKEWM